MSKSKPIPKLISRFEIGFDNETKVEIDALKNKLDDVLRGLSAKNASHGDRLLAAMQAEAANDAPQPELKQLEQWVFEGHDERLVTAFINANGVCRLTSVTIDHLVVDDLKWRMDSDKIKDNPDYFWVDLGGGFDNSDWRISATRRYSVNDVDYLSNALDESVPPIDDAINQSDWLSESVPQITQADMQLIFIKNLSECLIQRMHSMDRFSEDDYAIGGDKLMAWDCLIEAETGRFALVSGIGFENRTAIIHTFNQDFNDELFAAAYTLDLSFLKKTSLRTITEAELAAFRAALEACYA